MCHSTQPITIKEQFENKSEQSRHRIYGNKKGYLVIIDQIAFIDAV